MSPANPSSLLAPLFVLACTSAVPEPAKGPTKVAAKESPKSEKAPEPKPPSPKPPEPAPTTAVDPPQPREPTPSEPAPSEERWVCTKDAECVQTCALGAVNRGWIQANPNEDNCDDGCGWKSNMIACRDGGCVTLTAEGDIDESCTRRTKRM